MRRERAVRGIFEGEDFEYSEQFPDLVEGKCPWSYPLYPI
jgi:hypothetical protein